ncbi:Lactate utilization protein A [Planctomycetes bacterium Poly30]|uniref:Lactate utilization protein A n=1 Tax=Saltatorellus ferox TaxID=2528018 RepID=A0A518EKL6_9BACT|nr:Lactate utilization protein A [Planctomycetes bacterium Poly30]
MNVSLFVTCLVDGFWPGVGVSAVKVLRKAGCTVRFEPRQTCCGQPAYNTGYEDEARRVVAAMLDAYENDDSEAIVMPSGSCAAMVQHAPRLFEDDPRRLAQAKAFAARSHEFSSFLVDVLGVTEFGSEFEGRVIWHDACHGLRDLGVREQPRQLLRKVRGLELIEAAGDPTCCGFGGTFSVKQPEVSTAMLDTRLAVLRGAHPDVIASSDVSCLMQMDGRLRKDEAAESRAPRAMHLAEVLASGLD